MLRPARNALLLIALAAPLACVGEPARPEVGVSTASPTDDEPEPARPDDLPAVAENFVLIDNEGAAHELYRESDAKAIVIVSHGLGCPIGRIQNPRIMELRDEFADQGVVFWFLNAGDRADFAELQQEIEEYSIDVPVLLDESQLVTRGLAIERMAEALVIEPGTWRIVYRGAIDDRVGYGTQRPEADHHWLRDAIQAVLDGRPVEVDWTPARGCLIWFEEPVPPDRPISYARDVAPILGAKCVGCHQEGGMGPFAMDSWDRVRRWSPMMREVIRTRRMPPWFADPHYGEFANDCSLDPNQKRTLVHWIEDGSLWPEAGNETDPLAQLTPAPPTDWPRELGEPDLVIPIEEAQELPATGLLDYHYVRGVSPLQEGRWIRAAVLRPTNPRVLHHGTVYLESGSDEISRELRVKMPASDARNQKYFALYVPGVVQMAFPEGTGKYMPAGAKFTFELHYTTTGKPEVDHSEMGLYFADEPPERQLFQTTATVWHLDIPPGVREQPATAFKKFDRDVLIYDMVPHMHYRGRRMTYDLHLPSGEVERILSVPDYDFNWQLSYRPVEPIHAPKGSILVCWGTFDNSATNPLNPDPTQHVTFGYQTSDEMWIGSLAYCFAEP